MLSDCTTITTLFLPSLISGFNLQQISILVGAILSIGFIITVWIENWRLENKTPSIKIKPFVDLSKCAKLEIFNNGARAKFAATFKVIKGDFLDLANLYELAWETKEEINHKGTGIISVAQKAHIKEPYRTPALNLFFKEAITGNVRSLITGYWDTDKDEMIDKTKPPNHVYLEISITSEPPLKKSFSNLIFKLSQSTLTDLDFNYLECKTAKIRKLKNDKEGYLS